jgi:hypothetical protein
MHLVGLEHRGLSNPVETHVAITTCNIEPGIGLLKYQLPKTRFCLSCPPWLINMVITIQEARLHMFPSTGAIHSWR